MKRKLGIILLLAIFLAGSLISTGFTSDSFPNKPIIWIVPGSPGGGYDTYSRVVGAALKKNLPNDVEIIVKNITGGGGVIGGSALYRSKPDGYTIGFVSYPGLWMRHLIRGVGFDLNKLVNIAQIATTPQALFVSAKSPITSLDDIRKKEKIKLVSTGKGLSYYAFCVIAAKLLGFKAEMLTGYEGTSELIPAIMRGDGEGGIMNLPATAPYLKSGDLKAIVTFTPKRSNLCPNVPSVAELGYEDATVIVDHKMLFGPPGLPRQIVNVYQSALRKAYNEKKILDWSEKTGNNIDLLIGKDMAMRLEKVKTIYQKYLDLYR